MRYFNRTLKFRGWSAVETRVAKVDRAVWVSIPSRTAQVPETTFQAVLSNDSKVSAKARRLPVSLGRGDLRASDNSCEVAWIVASRSVTNLLAVTTLSDSILSC